MIQITEKLRIVKADDKNLALEELRDVTSKKSQTTNKQWRWCGWYGDLKTALIGALHKQLLDSAEEELQIKDLIERIEKVENNIIKSLKCYRTHTEKTEDVYKSFIQDLIDKNLVRWE